MPGPPISQTQRQFIFLAALCLLAIALAWVLIRGPTPLSSSETDTPFPLVTAYPSGELESNPQTFTVAPSFVPVLPSPGVVQ